MPCGGEGREEGAMMGESGRGRGAAMVREYSLRKAEYTRSLCAEYSKAGAASAGNRGRERIEAREAESLAAAIGKGRSKGAGRVV